MTFYTKVFSVIQSSLNVKENFIFSYLMLPLFSYFGISDIFFTIFVVCAMSHSDKIMKKKTHTRLRACVCDILFVVVIIVISTFGMSNLIFLIEFHRQHSHLETIMCQCFISLSLSLTHTHSFSPGICFNLKNIFAVTRSSKSGEHSELPHKMMNN